MFVNDPIIRIAARGDGVTASGRYVAFTAPGDNVDVAGAIKRGPNYATPQCRHFLVCGGCQLQHLSDDAYATYVTERIVGALAAQNIGPPLMAAPHISPPKSRRRASLRAEKRGKQVVVGFNEAASHKIIDLRQCQVMDPELFSLLQPLRGLLAHVMRDRRSSDIRMTIVDQGVDLLIAGVEVDGLEAVESLTAFAQKHGLARLSIDEGYGPSSRFEPEAVTITLGAVAVPLPEGAFLQATRDGEAALISAVGAQITGAKQVADLFSGLGTFAFSVDADVHGVEGARDAVLGLQMAANREKRSITTEHRDLFRRPLTPVELARFDAVILDPPRAGAREQIEQLAQSDVPRIAYVSCNPATFARDARTLIDGGYRLENIQPVGQFRWSTHVELAAAFNR